MAKNSGKTFEQAIKVSLPDYCFVQRLWDQPQSYVQSADTRFSSKNMCDYIVFDTKHKLLYLMEMKTTKYRSMAYEDIHEENPVNKMIHKHQILGLNKCSDYDNVVPCFILNFRNEGLNEQRTYFLHIDNFMKMITTINKKSFDEIDIIQNGAIKINGQRKRTRYVWDMNEFLSKYGLNFCK